MAKQKLWIMFFSVVLSFAVSFFLYASGLDINIAHYATAWVVPFGTQYGTQEMWGYLSRMGQEWFQMSVCVFFGMYYYKKCNYRMSRVWYGSIVVYLAAGIFVQFIKITVGRPRPKMLPEYDPAWFEMASRMHSWPSGHTITTFAWLACVLPFYPRKVQVLLFVIASFISISRVGIGSHYISDVLSAAVLGYVFAVLLRDKLRLGTKK